MKTQIISLFKSLTNACIRVRLVLANIGTPAPRAIPANCNNINSLLMHLCDFEPAIYSYILKWLAYPLQNPGAKMQTALIINGKPGTGATLFFDQVAATLYGPQGKWISANRFLVSNFNGWADDARLVVVEGDYSQKLAAKLKSLITSDTVIVQRQDKPMALQTNRINLVLLTPGKDFLPVAADDRRFMIVEAPPSRDALFYQAIKEEMDNGGVEAFRAQLLAIDLAGFNESTRSTTWANKRMEVA